MKTATVLAAAILAILAGCEEKPQTGDVKTTKVSQSLEYQLAVYNARGMIPEDHPTIPQIKTVLSSLDTKYPEDAKKIGELSLEGQRALEHAGVQESLLGLMQNIDKAGGTHANYAAAVNAYVAKRKPPGR